MFSIRTIALLAPLVAQAVVSIPHLSNHPEAFNASAKVYEAHSPRALLYDGCTDDQNQLIDSALAMFHPLSRGAKAWYDAITLPGVDPAVQRAAQRTHSQLFGTLKQGDNQKYRTWNDIIITQIFKNAVQGWNDNWAAYPRADNPSAWPLSITCEGIRTGGCQADFRAYTTAGSKQIHMCPLYFTPEQGPKELDWNILSKKQGQIAAGTIAHEISHSRYLIGIFDDNEQPYTIDQKIDDEWVYGWDKCAALAQETSWKAMTNADNYKFYFQRAFYEYCQCSDYQGNRDLVPVGSDKGDICQPFWDNVKKSSSCTIS